MGASRSWASLWSLSGGRSSPHSLIPDRLNLGTASNSIRRWLRSGILGDNWGVPPNKRLKLTAARRLGNESFFSAPQLKRHPLGSSHTPSNGEDRAQPHLRRDWSSLGRRTPRLKTDLRTVGQWLRRVCRWPTRGSRLRHPPLWSWPILSHQGRFQIDHGRIATACCLT